MTDTTEQPERRPPRIRPHLVTRPGWAVCPVTGASTPSYLGLMSLVKKIESELNRVVDALADGIAPAEGQQRGAGSGAPSRDRAVLPIEMVARIAAEVAEEDFRQR
jgi:hypothetical protein